MACRVEGNYVYYKMRFFIYSSKLLSWMDTIYPFCRQFVSRVKINSMKETAIQAIIIEKPVR